MRGILNKLTPEKFEKLINDVLNVGLDSSTILKGVIVLVSIFNSQFTMRYLSVFPVKSKVCLLVCLFVYFQRFDEFFS